MLQHLEAVAAEEHGRDRAHDLEAIASAWVHHWLAVHDGHDCALLAPDDPQSRSRYLARIAADGEYERWIACRMHIRLRRADVETVRRAVKSLAREGLVTLDHDTERRGQLMVYASE